MLPRLRKQSNSYWKQQHLSTTRREFLVYIPTMCLLDAPLFAFKLMASIEGGIVMCRTMDTAKPMQSLIKSLKSELEQYVL